MPEGYLEHAIGLHGTRRPDTNRPTTDPTTIRARRTTAARYTREGQPRRAVILLRETLDDAAGAPLGILVDVHRDLADLLVDEGEPHQAVHACAAALDAMAHRLPPDHPAVLAMRLQQARAHAAMGDVTTAADLFRTIADEFTPDTTIRAEWVIATRETAINLATIGDHAEAETILVRLLTRLTDAAWADSEQITATSSVLALLRASAGSTP